MKRSPLRRKLERMAAFKLAAWEQRWCLACQADTDPRNAMRLCVPCHERHHNRTRPIPLAAVSHTSPSARRMRELQRRDGHHDDQAGVARPPRRHPAAHELLGGWDGADAFFERFYDCSGRKPDITPAPTAMLPQQNPHRWIGY